MVKNKIKLIYALFCVIIFNHRNRSGSGTFRSIQTYLTVLSKSKGNHMGGNMGRKDKVLKDYFSDPERFCDFINGAVFDGSQNTAGR